MASPTSFCETARPNSPSLPVTRPVRASEPTQDQEPITLDEAKKQCGIAGEINFHNDDLRRTITAAREQVEADTGLVCYTGSFTWKLTQFPATDWLELPGIRPITAISSIAYVDTAGATQTWSSSNYSLETSGVTQFVRLAYGASWPTTRGDINGITVTFTAGYATVLAVPQRVKQACLFLVNHWFVSRDTVSIGTISPSIELTYDALVRGLMRSTYP